MIEQNVNQKSANLSLPPLAAGLLIGGASRRMGAPKARLLLHDKTFAETIAATIHTRVENLYLLGDGPVPDAMSDLPRICDPPDVEGPLAGILAALRSRRDVAWLIVGCDQPLIAAAAIDWLISWRRLDRIAIIPRTAPDKVDPLFAVYEPGMLKTAEKLLADGVLSPVSFADADAVCTPTPPDELQACWTNVNTPQDYERLKNKRRN